MRLLVILFTFTFFSMGSELSVPSPKNSLEWHKERRDYLRSKLWIEDGSANLMDYACDAFSGNLKGFKLKMELLRDDFVFYGKSDVSLKEVMFYADCSESYSKNAILSSLMITQTSNATYRYLLADWLYDDYLFEPVPALEDGNGCARSMYDVVKETSQSIVGIRPLLKVINRKIENGGQKLFSGDTPVEFSW